MVGCSMGVESNGSEGAEIGGAAVSSASNSPKMSFGSSCLAALAAGFLYASAGGCEGCRDSGGCGGGRAGTAEGRTEPAGHRTEAGAGLTASEGGPI